MCQSILHLMCDHHALSLCSHGVDLVSNSCANSMFNDSHAYTLTFLYIQTPYLFMLHITYQSFNSDICIFPLLPDCVYI